VKKAVIIIFLTIFTFALVGCGEASVVGNWEFDRVVNDRQDRAFTQRLEFYEDGTGARFGIPILVGRGPFPFSWNIGADGLMYMTGSGRFEFEVTRNEFRMIFDRATNNYAVYRRVR